MYIKKLIQIEFANPSIKAMGCIKDIREAATNASINLKDRYDVVLHSPKLCTNAKVYVEIDIPEAIESKFAIGNHLRGISTYLLKKYGDKYNQYLDGKRLLHFIDATDLNISDESFANQTVEDMVLLAKKIVDSDPSMYDVILYGLKKIYKEKTGVDL